MIGTDQTAKRVTAACSRCGAIREFGADALAQRDVALCECSRAKVTPRQAAHARAWGWAQAAARMEVAEALHRVNKLRRR